MWRASLLAGIASRRIERSVQCFRLTRYHAAMTTIRYVYWQDGEMWLGYLEEFPDYMTQGESIRELEENLKDLHADLTSGQIAI